MRRAALAVAMSALLLAGCAGGGADASGTADAETPQAAGAAGSGFQAYTECLSQHGVDISSIPQARQRPSGAPTDLPSGFPTDRPTGAPGDFPSGGPPQGGGGGFGMGQAPEGVDEETWQAAQDACAGLRPTGGMRPGGGPGTGTVDYTVFWSCMADHDVARTSSGLPADLDTADPTVTAALAVCNALLPTSSPSPAG